MHPGSRGAVIRRAGSAVSFRSVNRPGAPDYAAGLQRHHLIPRALVDRPCFRSLLEALGRGAGLHDFRRNGLLLPERESAAIQTGLPLHRGPHRVYSEMVGERLGEIERCWSRGRRAMPLFAHATAQAGIAALQGDLRRILLEPGRTIRLNRHDRLGAGRDFAALDAMVDRLWAGTQRENGAVSAESAAIAA